jgi:hypothetical protein
VIDKFVEISLLYDFYGKMLTEKQQDIIDLYYMKDLSLGEISDLLKISRQAVHDNLRRAEKQLRQMEKKLGLVERFLKEKDKWSIVLGRIDRIIETLQPKENTSGAVKELEDIKDFISAILGG